MNSMTIHIRREFWEHRSLWIAAVSVLINLYRRHASKEKT